MIVISLVFLWLLTQTSTVDITPILLMDDLYVGLSPVFYPSACIHANETACLKESDGLLYVDCVDSNNICNRPISLAHCTKALDMNESIQLEDMVVLPDVGCRFLGGHCAYTKAKPNGVCIPAGRGETDRSENEMKL